MTWEDEEGMATHEEGDFRRDPLRDRCAQCGQWRNEHALANYADGALIGKAFLVCPVATWKAPDQSAEATKRAQAAEAEVLRLRGEAGAPQDDKEKKDVARMDTMGSSTDSRTAPTDLPMSNTQAVARLWVALKERVESEHDDATHWPKGSERDGHKGSFETCPQEDCALVRVALPAALVTIKP